MARFPIVPTLQRFGGGSKTIHDLMASTAPNAAWSPQFELGYKLKIDGSGYWDADHTTAITAGTSQVITVNTTFQMTPFPTNVWICRVSVRMITAFSGGGVTAATLSVGDAGNDDEWVDLMDIFTGVTAGVYEDSADADSTSAVAGVEVPEAAYSPLFSLTSTTANLSALTAGELDVVFLIRPFLPAL